MAPRNLVTAIRVCVCVFCALDEPVRVDLGNNTGVPSNSSNTISVNAGENLGLLQPLRSGKKNHNIYLKVCIFL